MSDNGDDLDALLDEAMNIVDTQEKQHEEEVRLRDAKLQEDLQRALEETTGVGGGDTMLGGDMLKIFQSLMSAAGGSEDDGASMESFKRDVSALVQSLEGTDGLNPEDKANLDRVRSLMSVLDTEDDARAQEILEEMKRKDPSLDLPNLDGENANVDEVMKRCVESLQQLASVTEGSLGEGAGAIPRGASHEPSSAQSNPASCTGAASLPASLSDVPDNIANVLLETILNPQFVEPIRLMRDAYGPYLAENASKLSVAESERYQAQHAMTKQICDFLTVPIEKEDHDRISQLLEFMYEFSKLGEPPAELTEYAPNKKAENS